MILLFWRKNFEFTAVSRLFWLVGHGLRLLPRISVPSSQMYKEALVAVYDQDLIQGLNAQNFSASAAVVMPR